MQLWKLPASSNWSFNFESEELLEEFLRFLCHLVRARAATVEASVPEVAYKGQCSSVFSPRVYFSRTGLPVYSNIFFTTRQPPLHRNSQNHRQQEDGNPEADSASSLGQSLHFLCKCPEEKERKGKKEKKKKKGTFCWVKLLKVGIHSCTDILWRAKLDDPTCLLFFPPTTLPPPSKPFFFLEPWEDRFFLTP